MIESIENLIQLTLTAVCTAISSRRAFRTRKRVWAMLGLSSFAYFLGDLYWQLYLIFYGITPLFSNISDISWQASYLFLLLLLSEVQDEGMRRYRSRALWLVPVFTTGMCVFYMQWGDYIANVIWALIMTHLIWRAAAGLLYRHRTGEAAEKRWLSIAVLVLCAAEYASWTLSCFWIGDTLLNPYFWANLAVSLTFIMLIPALGKAVSE